MMSPNRQAVEAAYQAFGDGDMDAFTTLLDGGFVSTQSEAVPWRGRYVGPHGVRRMFALVGERADAHYRPQQLIESEDAIVVLGQATITPHADQVSRIVRELHVWRVDAGRLLSLDVFLDTPQDLLSALTEGP
jgi:ketosteroid isomerase-like protein